MVEFSENAERYKNQGYNNVVIEEEDEGKKMGDGRITWKDNKGKEAKEIVIAGMMETGKERSWNGKTLGKRANGVKSR